jgi:hypothetical protein
MGVLRCLRYPVLLKRLVHQNVVQLSLKRLSQLVGFVLMLHPLLLPRLLQGLSLGVMLNDQEKSLPRLLALLLLDQGFADCYP